LQSLEEVVRFFGDSGDLKNKKRKTNEGKVDSDGYYVNDQYNVTRIAKDGEDRVHWWWLRSPGDYSGSAMNVDIDGCVNVSGYNVNHDKGDVRPALWLNLQSRFIDIYGNWKYTIRGDYLFDTYGNRIKDLTKPL
jgi:hypothetical protein